MRSGAGRAQGTPCSTVPPSPAAAHGGPGVAAEPPEQGREVAPNSGCHCCSPVPVIPFTSSSGTALMAPHHSHSTDLGLFGCFATQPCVSVQRRVFLPCFLLVVDKTCGQTCCYFVPCIPLKKGAAGRGPRVQVFFLFDLLGLFIALTVNVCVSCFCSEVVVQTPPRAAL